MKDFFFHSVFHRFFVVVACTVYEEVYSEKMAILIEYKITKITFPIYGNSN